MGVTVIAGLSADDFAVVAKPSTSTTESCAASSVPSIAEFEPTVGLGSPTMLVATLSRGKCRRPVGCSGSI